MSGAQTTLDLIERARDGVIEGYAATATSARWLAASLAALRAGAAVLSARTHARRPGSAPADLWGELARTSPELAEWAEVFAAVSAERIAVETGLVRVGLREADDLLRAAEEFLEVVSGRLGLPVSDHRGLRLASTRTA